MFHGVQTSLSDLVRVVGEEEFLLALLVGDSGFTYLPFQASILVEPSHRDLSTRISLIYSHQKDKWTSSTRLNAIQVSSARDVQHILIESVRSMIKELAPFVYELDPRIGHPRTEFYRFKSFPAFDRPDGKHEIRDIEGNLVCSYCGKTFLNYQVPDPKDLFPVWSGGNFLWMHRTCHESIFHPQS